MKTSIRPKFGGPSFEAELERMMSMMPVAGAALDERRMREARPCTLCDDDARQATNTSAPHVRLWDEC